MGEQKAPARRKSDGSKTQEKTPINVVKKSSITIRITKVPSKKRIRRVRPRLKFKTMRAKENLNGSNLLTQWTDSTLLLLLEKDHQNNKEKPPPKMRLPKLIWATVK